MEKYQQQAWECLLPQEQQSLFINMSEGLSSRKGGEVLKISHYKYLEIRARAEKFFRLFSDYFAIHPSLVDPNSVVSQDFVDYLYAAMVRRLPKEEALEASGDSAWRVRVISNEKIQKNVLKLKESAKGTWDNDLYILIMEFDRWNNYRILPRFLQAPSAFKRRSQRKDKSYIQYLHHIPEYKIRSLVDIYWRNGRPDKRYYVCFISDYFTGGYCVTPIKRDKSIVSSITKLRIYIFETQDEADMYGLLIHQYFTRTKLSRSESMQYWKEYRTITKKAINFSEVQNTDFSVFALDEAYGLRRKPNIPTTKGKKLKRRTPRQTKPE